MAKSRKEFGQLLTHAVKTIQTYEPRKTIESIHRELGSVVGKKDSAIEYWRRGYIPSNHEDVGKLAQELFKRAGFYLGQKWLEDFLESADYPYKEELCSELCSKITKLIPNQLPAKFYGELIGRGLIIDDILAALEAPNAYCLIGIDGMGGIGKSAIAIEIGHHCLKNSIFNTALWISAEPGKGHRFLTFDVLLNEIGEQLGAKQPTKLSLSEKIFQVRSLLQKQRVLLILDNLDTAREPQKNIAQQLLPLLGVSKAILTSRHRFSGDIFPVHLIGLDDDTSKDFIYVEGRKKKISHINSIKRDELQKITSTAGGSPLAMKLVVGQLEYLKLSVVLKHLSKVEPLQVDAEMDDYIGFYRHIFFSSWELLSINAKQLLLSMAPFPSGIGGRLEAIQATSELSEDVLHSCVDELWRLSLVEISESSSIAQKRYYLHTLTKHFVWSDIAQLNES